MHFLSLEKYQSSILLVARVLLVGLFIIFGYQKLIHFGGTIGYMQKLELPLPSVTAAIVVLMEFFAGLAIVLGFFTRPIALMMAIYTLGTAIIGHPFWTASGPEHFAAEVGFYKNISIIGGLLLLSLTGPGKYSVNTK